MHPGMMYWWKRAREHAGREAWAGCDAPAYGGAWHGARGSGEHFGAFGAGAFGVRRPLRFLAYKLDLDEKQVEQLVRILSDLKTERAQAEVDTRRTLSALADAVEGDTFNAELAGEAGQRRVASAERLRDAVTGALQRMHAVLDAEQRARLAYLIRTGTLVV
jgi:Spy/CpxP family protein refolding chaperone